MEKQACTVSALKPAQATSDGDMKKLLVAQYGHASDEELWYPFLLQQYYYYWVYQTCIIIYHVHKLILKDW